MIINGLEFEKAKIVFTFFNISNTFSRLKSSVAYTCSKPRYSKFNNIIHLNYSDYLDFPIGEFLLDLKLKNDPFYKSFLNPNGDKLYCKFNLKDNVQCKGKGIYLYILDGVVVYAGRCRDSFGKRFNSGYGIIAPKNCYIDGQSTNCHINSLVNAQKGNLEIFLFALKDGLEIEMLEKNL